MNIQQVNISYIADEDRLLLRLKAGEQDEFRFWLTRACLRNFLPQSNAWLAAADSQPGAEAMQNALKRESAAAAADFSSQFAPGQNFPLGETPLLVIGMQLNANNRDACMRLLLSEQRLITLNLDETAMASVQRLLREIIVSAGWELNAELALENTPPAFASMQLH